MLAPTVHFGRLDIEGAIRCQGSGVREYYSARIACFLPQQHEIALIRNPVIAQPEFIERFQL